MFNFSFTALGEVMVAVGYSAYFTCHDFFIFQNAPQAIGIINYVENYWDLKRDNFMKILITGITGRGGA